MLYALGVVVGLVAGWFIFKLRFINGVLKMTETDDKDVYTLFIDDMERILRRKYLLLKIDKRTRK
jgi:hypothetical protein